MRSDGKIFDPVYIERIRETMPPRRWPLEPWPDSRELEPFTLLQLIAADLVERVEFLEKQKIVAPVKGDCAEAEFSTDVALSEHLLPRVNEIRMHFVTGDMKEVDRELDSVINLLQSISKC